MISKLPSCVSAAATTISLRVSVPVLSVQITETDPIASIAGRRRTIAWRLAMACTPMASVTVITAGRPSGMAETAMATTVMNRSEKFWCPTKYPQASKRLAASRIRNESQRAK